MDNETETVSDNDELIARFMGHQYDKKEFGVSRVLFKNLWLPPKYSTSFDWLMPVVEKISRHIYESWEDSNGYKNVTHHERAYLRTFGMMDSEGKWLVRINRMPLEQEDTLIKATYKAVVEWIKMFNSQSPDTIK